MGTVATESKYLQHNEIEAKTMPLLASHLLKRGNNENDDEFGLLNHQSTFHFFSLKIAFGHKSSEMLV
jgi:hypothetical protein